MRDVISSYKDAICRVRCSDLESAGTGFFVRPDGVLLTCCHVISRFMPDPQPGIPVEYCQDIRVETTLGTYPASIVHDQNSTHPIFEDYAILRIDAEGRQCLPVGDYGRLEPGDRVLIAGYPLGVSYLCATSGMISAKHRSPSHINGMVNLDMIQVDGSVNMGNSGGPLIHVDSSSVVGIVSVRVGSIERNIQNLKAMPEVAENHILTEIFNALEGIHTYLNPGIGQAVSIDYARAELATLNLI